MPESGIESGARSPVILVATDLNDLDRLMPFALREATESATRMILLHVLPAAGGMAIDPIGMPYYDPTSAIESASVALEPWRRLARKRNILCDVLVREGNAAQQIAACSRQFQAECILLGTRSRSKISKLLLGSVAEQVLRSVNLPVMTVGPEAHLPVESNDRQKVVLHATTLGETSRPSAALACQIAASHRARLVLLHVLPRGYEAEVGGQASDLDSAALRELRILASQVAEDAKGSAGPVEARVAYGHPAIEILAAAADLAASLIVLGSTDRSKLQNLTRDRTVYRVLAHARCPVLTLREALPIGPAKDVEQFASRL
jgi:nucleotide-binding universal stress UspA family protein